MKINIEIETLQVTPIKTANDAVSEPSDLNELQQLSVVKITGEMNTNTAPLVQEQILPLTQAPQTKMILEMTQVPYMSSAGLRVLLSLYRQITAKGGQIILVGLSEEIRDTMSITGFLDFFKTSDTLEQALEGLKVKVQAIRT